jgi:cbb3-type cytochrome oxidase maturation protein
MSGLDYLIPIALVMGLGALAAFLWALGSGQYEDLQGAGERILDDDDAPLSTHDGKEGSPKGARRLTEPVQPL